MKHIMQYQTLTCLDRCYRVVFGLRWNVFQGSLHSSCMGNRNIGRKPSKALGCYMIENSWGRTLSVLQEEIVGSEKEAGNTLD